MFSSGAFQLFTSDDKLSNCVHYSSLFTIHAILSYCYAITWHCVVYIYILLSFLFIHFCLCFHTNAPLGVTWIKVKTSWIYVYLCIYTFHVESLDLRLFNVLDKKISHEGVIYKTLPVALYSINVNTNIMALSLITKVNIEWSGP